MERLRGRRGRAEEERPSAGRAGLGPRGGEGRESGSGSAAEERSPRGEVSGGLPKTKGGLFHPPAPPSLALSSPQNCGCGLKPEQGSIGDPE